MVTHACAYLKNLESLKQENDNRKNRGNYGMVEKSAKISGVT